MRYFKDNDNMIHAFEDSVTDEFLAKAISNRGLTESSEEEFVIIMAPDVEQLAEQIRTKRNALLREFDTNVYCNALRWAEYTEATKTALAVYRQQLKDVSEQAGFPHDVVFPVMPKI